MQKVRVWVCLCLLVAPNAMAWDPQGETDLWVSVSQWVAETLEEIHEGVEGLWVGIWHSEEEPPPPPPLPPLPDDDGGSTQSNSSDPPPNPGSEDDDDGSNFGGGYDPYG